MNYELIDRFLLCQFGYTDLEIPGICRILPLFFTGPVTESV